MSTPASSTSTAHPTSPAAGRIAAVPASQPGKAPRLRVHEGPRKECLGEGVLTGEREIGDLPDPEPLLRNLGRSVFEVLAGVREVEQMARWITPAVFSTVLARAQHAARSRRVRGRSVRRPVIETRACLWQSPRPGVVEASVIVDLGQRVRAVVIRLEVFRGRWRAERLHVL